MAQFCFGPYDVEPCGLRQYDFGQCYFVAGTDTHVGKTWVSVALLHAAADRGLTTAALKPVAAGCEATAAGLRNEDALNLQQAMTADLAYEIINPVPLRPPIAPHLAAEQAQQPLTVEALCRQVRPVMQAMSQDFMLIEGAGGWRVPLNDQETLADLARALAIPVILVVGLRLGCLNHALLTAEAIERDGLSMAGWVANHIDPDMAWVDDNVQSLRGRLSAPFLGYIPFLPQRDGRQRAQYLDVDTLLVSA